MSIKAATLKIVLTVGTLSFLFYQYHVSCLDGSKYTSQGENQLFQDRYEQALESFASAVAQVERSNRAMFFSKGMTLSKAQNCVKAMHGMGCAYAAMGKYEDAKECLTKVLDFDPYYSVSKSKRASVLCSLGDYDGAVSDYNDILQSAPNATNTYYNRGCAYVQIEEYAKALADFARAVELSADGLHSYERLHYMNGMASLLATCPNEQYRDADKAIELAEQVVSTAESTFDERSGARTLGLFKDTLAAGYAGAGRYEDALASARQAMKLLQDAGADQQDIEAVRRRLETYEAAHDPKTGITGVPAASINE